MFQYHFHQKVVLLGDFFLQGNELSGIIEDFFKFGCDISEWMKVKYGVKNRRCAVCINGENGYDTTVKSRTTKTIGIIYSFKGTRSVKFIKFSRSE